MAKLRRLQISSRKQPQQARSAELVAAILQAAEQVLAKEGATRFTTARVAEKAGVSVGSVYQYFPNKEAVLSAIVDRYSDDVSERVTASLADRFDETGPEMVRATLHALLDALEDNTELLRVVADELPRSENVARVVALEHRITGLMSAYLSARRPLIGRDVAPTTAAWIMVHTMESLTVRYVLDRPPIDRTTFVAELEHLVTAYLPEA